MVGRLSKEARYEIVDLINAVIEQDSQKVLWIVLQFAIRRGNVNPQMMQKEIDGIRKPSGITSAAAFTDSS